MRRALVSLGSNIEPGRNIPRAIAMLRERARVVAVSRIFRSRAWGMERAPDFWNAAVLIETELEPAALKRDLLRRIEVELGRERGANRNAPRTIDLDVALYEQRIVDEPGLQIPDPGVVQHAFIARPLADVAPDWRHPADGRSLRAIADLLDGPAPLEAITDPEPPQSP